MRGGSLVFVVTALVGCGEHGSSAIDAPPVVLSSAKELTSFRVLAADNRAISGDLTATITDREITGTTRFPDTLAGLKPVFTTTGVQVSANGARQISGETEITLFDGLVYTVTAQDGSTHDYSVHVTPLSFRLGVDVPTGMSPASIATADLNADGKPDLLVTNQTPPSFSILINTTATGATRPSFVKTDVPTVAAPGGLAVGDFTGDGRPDVALANPGPGTVSVFVNATTPGTTTTTIGWRSDVTAGPGAFAIAVADLNADGKPDLAVANGTVDDTFSVLLDTTPAGATMATFAPKVDYVVGPTPSSIAAADLDGDGRPDLIASHLGGYGRVWAWINTTPAGAATPSFAASLHLVSGQNVTAAYPGDINADGKVDLVVGGGDIVAGTSVAVNTTPAGTTPPTFASPVPVDTSGPLRAAAFADFDQDGTMDVLGPAVSGLSLMLGTTPPGATTASFRKRRGYGSGTSPNSVVVADLNADGKPDAAATNTVAGGVSVFLAE